MVKGKTVFVKWDHKLGMFFESQIRKNEYIIKMEKAKLREQAIGEVIEMMVKTRREIDALLRKKKLLNMKMASYISKNCAPLQEKIDGYTTTITKATAARSICKKSLICTKKELADEFRREHPLTELKKMQNKYYKLNIKRWRL